MPIGHGNLSGLCEALTSYEMNAQFTRIYAVNRDAEAVRAEVKDQELCRVCMVKLDATNRAKVTGYQCIACKRKAHAAYVAKQRADRKAAVPP
jgi:ribosomal protein L37AE/L43A